MYRVVTEVKVFQKTQIEGKAPRNRTVIFNFVNSLQANSSWRDFTNTGEIVVPKNTYVKDGNGKLVPLGSNTNIGGFSDSPLFMRGDKVIMNWGYIYYKNGVETFFSTYDAKTNTNLFEGWISEVFSQKPMKFKIEDNFWKLKQIACPTIVFSKTTTLETMLRTLLKDTEFTVNALTNTTFGNFRVGNQTVAEVLEFLRKNYHFESYFKGTELRCGAAVYIESEAKNHTFTFQQNIIEDDLKYNRKDDLTLSIVAYNQIETATGKKTKDGHPKTKKKRIEVLVVLRGGSDKPIVFKKEKGKDFPANLGGERMTIPYIGAITEAQLAELAAKEIKKYYYTGFRGKFTTFGMPFVQFGDNVTLIDPVLPERNGKYKVKAVEYSGGTGGLRQEIELDFKMTT